MKTQKFFKGDLVKIGQLSPNNSHFPQNCEAIVIQSGAEYNDHIGSDRYSLYILKKGCQGEHSWYDEGRLTLIEPDRFDRLPKSNIHRKVYEAKKNRNTKFCDANFKEILRILGEPNV